MEKRERKSEWGREIGKSLFWILQTQLTELNNNNNQNNKMEKRRKIELGCCNKQWVRDEENTQK